MGLWLNEWMNEWSSYIAHYSVLLYTQSALQSCGGGGSLLNHHQCTASSWMMRRLPQDNGASALTTHQIQVERRESHRANQVNALTTHQIQVERRESHRANQVNALTTHQIQVERERVIEPIKWMGIIRRSWLIRVSGGNLARTPGLHPYSLREVPWDFNDDRESGPRFNVSSERRVSADVLMCKCWCAVGKNTLVLII